MTKFILVRHANPDYSVLENCDIKALNGNIAFLSEKGIIQAKNLAKDPIFDGAEVLICSPYTRTMQTASYISLSTGLDITGEFDLHEWVPDVNALTFDTNEKIVSNYKKAVEDFNSGTVTEGAEYEDMNKVRERALKVLDKYLGYSKVIVVTHSGVLYSLTKKRFKQAEYMEFEYSGETNF